MEFSDPQETVRLIKEARKLDSSGAFDKSFRQIHHMKHTAHVHESYCGALVKDFTKPSKNRDVQERLVALVKSLEKGTTLNDAIKAGLKARPL